MYDACVLVAEDAYAATSGIVARAGKRQHSLEREGAILSAQVEELLNPGPTPVPSQREAYDSRVLELLMDAELDPVRVYIRDRIAECEEFNLPYETYFPGGDPLAWLEAVRNDTVMDSIVVVGRRNA
jgi:hypothetical protein